MNNKIYNMFRTILYAFNGILCLFSSQSLFAEIQTDKPIITCCVSGQLGNQLFQIATTLAYAWDYDAFPTFFQLNLEGFGRPYNRDRLFFRLCTEPSPRPFLHVFQEEIWFSDKPIPFRPDQVINGAFQSWAHFHRYRDRLLKVFQISEADEKFLEKKHHDLLIHPMTVAVHVRTFNKETHDAGLHFVGLDYYRKAMDLWPPEALFVVFSDRINWCKHHFSAFNKSIVYIEIEDNDHIHDLALMSKMKHHIICNSTYSWWGAYLCQNPEQVVVAPRYWVNPYIQFLWPQTEINTFYLPHWQMIDFDYTVPYPADMRDYDAKSESIDTQ